MDRYTPLRLLAAGTKTRQRTAILLGAFTAAGLVTYTAMYPWAVRDRLGDVYESLTQPNRRLPIIGEHGYERPPAP